MRSRDRWAHSCAIDSLEEDVLHWTYILISACFAAIVIRELFDEQRWREQLALGMVLIPLLLRILHVK